MKRKILFGLIASVIVLVFIAKTSISNLPDKDSSVPLNVNNILCYQKTKNICVDYMGEHPDFCVSETGIRHQWCHENYCINKEFSCQGGGTNQCITEDSGKCKFVY